MFELIFGDRWEYHEGCWALSTHGECLWLRCEVVSSVQQVVLAKGKRCMFDSDYTWYQGSWPNQHEGDDLQQIQTLLIAPISIFRVLYFIQVVFYSIYEIDTLKLNFTLKIFKDFFYNRWLQSISKLGFIFSDIFCFVDLNLQTSLIKGVNRSGEEVQCQSEEGGTVKGRRLHRRRKPRQPLLLSPPQLQLLLFLRLC